MVQYVGIQIVRFCVVIGQTAAARCLPLCISLRNLCTADCFLSISPAVTSIVNVHHIFDEVFPLIY